MELLRYLLLRLANNICAANGNASPDMLADLMGAPPALLSTRPSHTATLVPICMAMLETEVLTTGSTYQCHGLSFLAFAIRASDGSIRST